MAFGRLNQVLVGEQFEYLLDLEVHKASRYLYFFSLLAVQFNGHDAEGELGNDQSVASTMSRLIRGVIRETDVVGRMNGTKFFVMLHQADHQQARLSVLCKGLGTTLLWLTIRRSERRLLLVARAFQRKPMI